MQAHTLQTTNDAQHNSICRQGNIATSSETTEFQSFGHAITLFPAHNHLVSRQLLIIKKVLPIPAQLLPMSPVCTLKAVLQTKIHSLSESKAQPSMAMNRGYRQNG